MFEEHQFQKNAFVCFDFSFFKLIFLGLLELDVNFRGEVIAYMDGGASKLPKHTKSFIEREKLIKELNIKLKNGEIPNNAFLNEIGDLFIHSNWFKIIKDAVSRIEENPQQEADSASDIDDITDAIFLSTTTSRKNRRLSIKYFGKDWVNKF